jgi:hypothetical protein
VDKASYTFFDISLLLLLKEDINTSVDRKTGGSIAKDHFIFFIKDIIEAAENLNMRAQVERCGSIKESIAWQSNLRIGPG